MKKRIYKVRFHLANGPHKEHWQLSSNIKAEEPAYYDPEKYVLSIHQAKLVNHSGIAKLIHCGANKSVCAWIQSRTTVLSFPLDEGDQPSMDPSQVYYQIFYNPKEKPYWTDAAGNNLDNETFGLIQTHGRKVFAILGERPVMSSGQSNLGDK